MCEQPRLRHCEFSFDKWIRIMRIFWNKERRFNHKWGAIVIHPNHFEILNTALISYKEI